MAIKNKQESGELLAVIQENEIDGQTANQIKTNFSPFFDQVEEWKKRAMSIKVTSIDQKEEMKEAREARLALKNIRVNADKTRKKLKEDTIRYNRAVQGIYNVIEYLIKPIEDHLFEQEKFIEIQQKKAKEELRDKRESEIGPYIEFVPYGVDLAELSEEEYKRLLNQSKKLKEIEAREEQERRDEAERQAKIQRLHTERRELIIPYSQFWDSELSVANLGKISEVEFDGIVVALKQQKEAFEAVQEKLRKEAKEAEKKRKEAERKAASERKKLEEQAKKERQEAEAKLKEEQEARLKLEKKIKEEQQQREAEEKRIAEEERKKQIAPDKEKLLLFVQSIRNMPLPALTNKESLSILKEGCDVLEDAAHIIEKRCKELDRK